MSGVWAATPASDTVDLIISETIKKIVVDIQVFYLLFIFFIENFILFSDKRIRSVLSARLVSS